MSKVDGFDNALHHEFAGFDTSGVTIALPGFNSSMGRQMQSMLAYDPPAWHQSAPNGVNYYPGTDDTPTTATIDAGSSPVSSQTMSDSQTAAPMPMHVEPHAVTIRKPYSNFSAFIGGDGTIADLNQDQGASYAPSSKASYSSVDAIAGISYRMTSNLAAGVLFDYSHTDADTDSYGSKTKVDSYSPGVFATYGNKGFYLNGLFSYGRNEYSNNRAIPVIGSTASSSPDGNQYTGALDAGYDLHFRQCVDPHPAGRPDLHPPRHRRLLRNRSRARRPQRPGPARRQPAQPLRRLGQLCDLRRPHHPAAHLHRPVAARVPRRERADHEFV